MDWFEFLGGIRRWIWLIRMTGFVFVFQVNWYPWGDEAFEEARKRNVPIFLSSKYQSRLQIEVVLVDP